MIRQLLNKTLKEKSDFHKIFISILSLAILFVLTIAFFSLTKTSVKYDPYFYMFSEVPQSPIPLFVPATTYALMYILAGMLVFTLWLKGKEPSVKSAISKGMIIIGIVFLFFAVFGSITVSAFFGEHIFDETWKQLFLEDDSIMEGILYQFLYMVYFLPSTLLTGIFSVLLYLFLHHKIPDFLKEKLLSKKLFFLSILCILAVGFPLLNYAVAKPLLMHFENNALNFVEEDKEVLWSGQIFGLSHGRVGIVPIGYYKTNELVFFCNESTCFFEGRQSKGDVAILESNLLSYIPKEITEKLFGNARYSLSFVIAPENYKSNKEPKTYLIFDKKHTEEILLILNQEQGNPPENMYEKLVPYSHEQNQRDGYNLFL